MHEELYELKEKLLKEFGEYSKNGKFSKEDSEVMKNLSGTIDHICNIIEREEDEEYSQRGSYAYDNGNMGGGNMGGGSYRGGGYSRNRGNSYRMSGNSYARGRGQNARRDSMGRYSRGGDMVDQLEDLMEDAPNDQIRQQIQQLITQVEKM